MTRLELINRALKVIGDESTGSATDAETWVDLILYELESLDLWKFLQATTTYQTENTVDNVAFSAAKFPSAAITDYSKGMSVSSSLSPFGLQYVSFLEFKQIHGSEQGAPEIYSFWNETLWLHPTPITGSGTLPLLSLYYYKNITVPTADDDELSDPAKSNVPKKLHPALLKGVIAYGMSEIGDGSNLDWATLFAQTVTSILAVDNTDIHSIETDRYTRKQAQQGSSKEITGYISK